MHCSVLLLVFILSHMIHLDQASALDAQVVLIDADRDFILQDSASAAADGAQIVGHEERRGHDRPQRHLRARLVHAEAEVSNDQLRMMMMMSINHEQMLLRFQ